MDFETWFHGEMAAGRLYGADEEVARITWNSTVEQCALAAWKRGTEENEPGTEINRRVITGLIADDIRSLKDEGQ